MNKLLIVIAALLLTGCGTIQEQTLEYCDTTRHTFIGIPYSSNSDCVGVSNSETGASIDPPRPTPMPAP